MHKYRGGLPLKITVLGLHNVHFPILLNFVKKSVVPNCLPIGPKLVTQMAEKLPKKLQFGQCINDEAN